MNCRSIPKGYWRRRINTTLMLRPKDAKWRGFNPLRNIDEIYAKAGA